MSRRRSEITFLLSWCYFDGLCTSELCSLLPFLPCCLIYAWKSRITDAPRCTGQPPLPPGAATPPPPFAFSSSLIFPQLVLEPIRAVRYQLHSPPRQHIAKIRSPPFPRDKVHESLDEELIMDSSSSSSVVEWTTWSILRTRNKGTNTLSNILSPCVSQRNRLSRHFWAIRNVMKIKESARKKANIPRTMEIFSRLNVG